MSMNKIILFPISGVFVVFGKTKRYTILNAAKELYKENKIERILFMTGQKEVNPFHCLKESIGVSTSNQNKFLSSILPDNKKRFVLFIDKFDNIMNESFLTSLAEDCVKTKKYTVIACLEDYKNYSKVCKWNNGSKIHGI